MEEVYWIPLESNPENMTNFLHGVGLTSQYKVVDVFGFSEEMIAILPQPVYALIFLYPGEKVSISAQGDTAKSTTPPPKDVYFMKQIVRNACGSIALLHAVANITDRVTLEKDSPFEKFLAKTATLSPQERGEELAKNKEIASVHEKEASSGQTDTPAANANTEYHYTSFVEKNGRIYELNGGNDGPVDHGPSSPETFAQDVAKLCRKVISQTEDNFFSALAIVKDDE